LEIILVDDGSSDSSGNICDEYAKRDERIIVIHKNNGGLSDARNSALDICKGEYITFIDSDDFVSPLFVELLYSVMEKGNCDIVALKGGTDFWDGEIEPILVTSLSGIKVDYMTSDEALERMLYQHIATGAPFKFCRREIYDNIRFPYGYLYEDVATTYKLFINTKKSAIVYEDVYAYRKRRDSIIRQKFSEKKLIALKIFDQLIEDEALKKHGMEQAAICRAYSMLYSVFLQVDKADINHKKMIWNKLNSVSSSIRKNKSPLVRRKAKYASWISVLGMNASFCLGKKYGQKGTMN